MRQISEQELKEILDKHGKWLRKEEGGARANLSEVNLSRADLYGANLSEANLSGANLSGANLSRADLSRADLSGANLSRADLSGADLSEANLFGANLLTFQYQKHFALMNSDGIIQIGCIAMPVSEWVLGFEEIGKAYNYSSI